jgi:endonuclease/exonuclease/phosphatase family metal-dependent hydrolase
LSPRAPPPRRSIPPWGSGPPNAAPLLEGPFRRPLRTWIEGADIKGVRIATWNCQPGIVHQWDAVEALRTHVLSVQEIRSGTQEFVAEQDGWSCQAQEGKYGRGVAVLARRPFSIEEREASEPFVVSTVIAGPTRFRFVAFWAMTPKAVGYSYHRQAQRMIEQLPDDGLDTVVAGDFNASKHPRHLANIKRLRERDLVSAYHKHAGLAPGDVGEEVTAFTGRNGRPGFHIDLVFLQSTWQVDEVEVGTFDRYPGQHRSDHVPVVVTAKAPPRTAPHGTREGPSGKGRRDVDRGESWKLK